VEALRADCDSKKGRIAVFEKGGEVIPWHRVSDVMLGIRTPLSLS